MYTAAKITRFIFIFIFYLFCKKGKEKKRKPISFIWDLSSLLGGMLWGHVSYT